MDSPDAVNVGPFVGYLVTDDDMRNPEPVAFLPAGVYGRACAIALGREEPDSWASTELRGMLDFPEHEATAELVTFAFERIDFDPETFAQRPVQGETFAGFRYVHQGGDWFWYFWTRGASPFPKEESGTPASPVTPAPGSKESGEGHAPMAA